MLTKLFQYSILFVNRLKRIMKGECKEMAKLTLAAARVNKGLSQKEAAKFLNVSNKTLSNWEKGSTCPKTVHIDASCALYDVKYDDIYFFANKSALNG